MFTEGESFATTMNRKPDISIESDIPRKASGANQGIHPIAVDHSKAKRIKKDS